MVSFRSAAALTTLALSVSARPNTDSVLIRNVSTAVTQVQRINLLSDNDFIFDFVNIPMNASGVATGRDGHSVNANAANMPALIGQDISLTLGFIGPCGMNTPHTHPRSTEFNYVVNGSFTTGMFQENGARVVLGNVTAGQASLFPRGAIHFEANLECEPATFVAAFGDSDPGTLQIAQGLFGLPAQVVGAVLGNDLTQDQITNLKSMIPANIAIGLDECVKRCGLTF